MRVFVDLDANWTVRLSAPGQAADWLPARQLRRLADGRGGFLPFPAETELPEPSAPHHELCLGDRPSLVAEIQDRIARRTPQVGEVERFGRYLFSTLLGNHAWAAIGAAAAAANDREVELALRWAPTDLALHRLNWEMMRGPEDFLASGRPWPVGVTRMVAGARHAARPLQAPPRVLFVVGTRINDPEIRPGAEALGLLRRVQCRDRSIHSRIVQCATPERMRRAVADFHPDVVHLICHGDVDRKTGRGFLLLRRDDDHPDEDEPRYASQLLDYLQAAGSFPAIVVLSACQSAGVAQRGMLGAHDTAPLAAELIAGGVPVVVGMAGRVADSACRLFTRRFGEALLSGEPLVAATAEGRRAAFADGAPPHTAVDWAFPAVFIAEGVEHRYIAAPATADDRSVQIENWIKSFDLLEKPVFCAREEFFDAYHELMGNLSRPGGRAVLGAYCNEMEPGVGRTRLLKELAAHALRDGHAPVLLLPTPNQPIPTTSFRLGLELLKALAVTRGILGLPVPLDSSFLKRLLFERPHPQNDELRAEFADEPQTVFDLLLRHLEEVAGKSGDEGKLDPDAARKGLAKDFAALAQALREKHPPVGGGTTRVFVLLDGIDRYGEKLTTALLRQVLGPHGFGTPEEPVPVAVTFNATGPAQEVLRPIKESPPVWLKLLPLERFQPDGEDFLAYERVWLHPFCEDEALKKPLIVNPEARADKLEGWRGKLRSRMKGLPGNFTSDLFGAISDGALAFEGLVPADDEDCLSKLRQKSPKDHS